MRLESSKRLFLHCSIEERKVALSERKLIDTSYLEMKLIFEVGFETLREPDIRRVENNDFCKIIICIV